MKASTSEDDPNSGAWTDSGSLVAAVAAGVSAAPVPAWRIPFPAAAGISDPALGCLYLEHWVSPPGEGREDGRVSWVEQHCCSLPYCSAGCCSPDAADFHHDLRRDWLEGYKAPLLLSPK